MGLCAGGIWRARSEMGKLARSYDSSRISSSLLGVLLTAGCADIALALARNQSSFQLAGLHQAAMKAAAGQWQDAVESALGTHKRAIYYPRYSWVTVFRLSVIRDRIACIYPATFTAGLPHEAPCSGGDWWCLGAQP